MPTTAYLSQWLDLDLLVERWDQRERDVLHATDTCNMWLRPHRDLLVLL